MKKPTSPYTQLSDEQLMQLFQANGDRIVYSEIYTRYFKVLCKYIHWVSNGSLLADDIAQHILVKLYQKPSLFDTSKNLKVWLFVAAKNKIKNELRNRATRTAHHESIQASVPHPSNTNDMDGSCDSSTVSVHQLLQHLSEEQQEVIILKYTNSLTIKEISAVIGSSEGTVKSRIFYALQKMRSHIPNIQNQET